VNASHNLIVKAIRIRTVRILSNGPEPVIAEVHAVSADRLRDRPRAVIQIRLHFRVAAGTPLHDIERAARDEALDWLDIA
jgi:hypothetical protein